MTPSIQDKIVLASGAVAGASTLVAQALDVQLSGAQVVGWAVGIVGFLIAGLISVSSYFLTKELEGIKKGTAQTHDEVLKIRVELDAISTWKAERETAHADSNRETVADLRRQLAEKRGEK